MNTDDGFVVDYCEVLTPKRQTNIRALLVGVERSRVNQFIDAVQYPVSAYYANLKAHNTIPDAKDQERYLAKLENKSDKLLKLITEVSELINDAPFRLRRCSAEAGAQIDVVAINLIAMMQAINDISPSKSKYRPEVTTAVIQIATIFHETLHTEPVVRAFREKSDVPVDATVGEMFVPIVAELLSLSVDSAYRIAKKNLPS